MTIFTKSIRKEIEKEQNLIEFSKEAKKIIDSIKKSKNKDHECLEECMHNQNNIEKLGELKAKIRKLIGCKEEEIENIIQKFATYKGSETLDKALTPINSLLQLLYFSSHQEAPNLVK